jgi:endonuclease-3
MEIEELFEKVIVYFQQTMPVAKTELKYTSAYELLVAVILSAQCTDKRINQVTPPFFKSFPTPESLAHASHEKVFELVKSCSYPNNKTKHLINMANVLMDKFKGTVPDDVETLQQLPGVGRKTANVIVSVVYNKPAMAVDTHVHRVAARIGLTVNARTPLETEKQLVKHIPVSLLSIAHHWLILHGRYVCKARKPECYRCGLSDICKYMVTQKI